MGKPRLPADANTSDEPGSIPTGMGKPKTRTACGVRRNSSRVYPHGYGETAARLKPTYESYAKGVYPHGYGETTQRVIRLRTGVGVMGLSPRVWGNHATGFA